MKKIISILFVIMLSVCMLAGCGEETASVNPPKADTSVTTPEPATTNDSKDSSVMDNLRLIKELEQKNIALVAVYNEVAPLAVKNGWEADELAVKELQAADAAIQTFNSMIKDPASAKGADLPEILSATDDLIKELDTNFRQKVSKPFAN